MPCGITFGLSLAKDEKLRGAFNCETKKMYILRRKGSWTTFLHEWIHWFINLFVPYTSKIHDRFDEWWAL